MAISPHSRIVSCMTIVALIATVGCSTIPIELNAYLSKELEFPRPEAGSKIGVLANTSPSEPLLERELREKVQRLLEQRGYKTTEPSEADFILLVEAAIDAGTITTQYRATTTGSDYTRSYIYDRRGRMIVVNRQSPSRTYYVPQQCTVFTKGLGLTLAKRSLLPPADSQPAEDRVRSDRATVWRCVASATGPESDLRWIVNHLLVGAFECFGEDTQRQRRIGVAEKDKRVQQLMKPDENED